MAAENKLIQLLTFLYTRIRFLDIVFSAFSVFFMQFPSFFKLSEVHGRR